MVILQNTNKNLNQNENEKISQSLKLPKKKKIIIKKSKILIYNLENTTLLKSKHLQLYNLNNNQNFNLKNKINVLFPIKIHSNIKKFSFTNELILIIYNSKIKILIKYVYKFFKILLHLKTLNLALIELDSLLFLTKFNNIFLNFINYKNKILTIHKKITYNNRTLAFNTISINFSIFNTITLISILMFNKININKIKKYNFLIQKNLYMFFFNFNKNTTKFVFKKTNFSILNLYTYKFLFSFLYTRKINTISINTLKFFLLKFNTTNINTLKFLMWKNNNWPVIKKITETKLPLSYLYFIQRIEDKLDLLEFEEIKQVDQIEKLKNLRNLFYIFLDKKNINMRFKNKFYIAMNPRKINELKSRNELRKLKNSLDVKFQSNLFFDSFKRRQLIELKKATLIKLNTPWKTFISYKKPFYNNKLVLSKNKLLKSNTANKSKFLNVKFNNEFKKLKENMNKIAFNKYYIYIKPIFRILFFFKKKHIQILKLKQLINNFSTLKNKWKKQQHKTYYQWKTLIFNLSNRIQVNLDKNKDTTSIKLISKKIVYNTSYFNYKNNQELISLIFGFKINIYFINALALTRFELHIKMRPKKEIYRKIRSSLIFINNLERDFLKRYKFIANYLQDLTRVGFIAFYLKDLTFLVKFIAFQIKYLQKNRKETKLIKFISKAIKIFSGLRKEVVALKFQVKGRVNRWRRTKIITGKRGVIPYNSYSTRLEYATATAITRKGALGIRLWVYSRATSNEDIETALTKYIVSNKILKYKKLKRHFFLNQTLNK